MKSPGHEAAILASLEERRLNLGANHLPFFLLLFEVFFKLICGKAHLGESGPEWAAVGPQPCVL